MAAARAIATDIVDASSIAGDTTQQTLSGGALPGGMCYIMRGFFLFLFSG
jgi:ABC-type proline/glycine betaine transport system permease subunit